MWYVRCCVYIEQGCPPAPTRAPSFRGPPPSPTPKDIWWGTRGTRERSGDSAASAARAGGEIIYTTCTSSVHCCGRHGRDTLYLTVHSYKYYTYIINI